MEPKTTQNMIRIFLETQLNKLTSDKASSGASGRSLVPSGSLHRDRRETDKRTDRSVFCILIEKLGKKPPQVST